jgi:flagellar biosynthesis GTPase FlhF
MRKDIFSTILTVFALSGSVACDKQGIEERQKEQTPGSAARTQTQQTEAERAKAAEQDQFNKEREDFRRSLENELADVDAKITTLERSARTAVGTAKGKLDAALPSIHEQRRAIDMQLRAIGTASRTTFEETKAKVNEQLSLLKSAVDKAL